MPELPEIETIKRDLDKLILKKRINEVIVYDDRVIKTNDVEDFIANIEQKTINKIDRRGKLIIISLQEGGHLLAHLKMSGQLIYGHDLKSNPNLKDTKVTFQLSNGQYLNYNDQRTFGRLSFVRNLNDDQFLASIGMEPFDNGFNTDWLSQNLKKRRSPIKTLLLNQNFVAGIGNIYASEILFNARISPKKRAGTLTEKEISSLYLSTVNVLKEAIKYRGCSMRNYRDTAGQKGKYLNRVKVYKREHQPCPHCQLAIDRIVQSGRSTYFCRSCQQ